MKSWLKHNNTKMYSTHGEGKSLLEEQLIGTLKNKIYKHMTVLLKIVYIDKHQEKVKDTK